MISSAGAAAVLLLLARGLSSTFSTTGRRVLVKPARRRPTLNVGRSH